MALRENSRQNVHFLPGSAGDTSKAPHSGSLRRPPHSRCVASDPMLLPTRPLPVALILWMPAHHSALPTFLRAVSTAGTGSLQPCQSLPRPCQISGLSLHLCFLVPSELLLQGKASTEQVLEASGCSLTLWGSGQERGPTMPGTPEGTEWNSPTMGCISGRLEEAT